MESLEDNLGFYICTTAEETATKVISTADAPNYVTVVGGAFKIKFTNKNTATSGVTLKVGNANAAPFYYDGAPVTNTNTWEAEETVDVYFDGNTYFANNVAGGGTFATGEKVKNVGIDDEPTAGSENLVKSGGIQNELALGAVYDVSAKNPTAGPNNDGKFTLEYILNQDNVNTLIPTTVRKGGMSIKFVQSSDNNYTKYVQYFLTKEEWSSSVGDWEKMNLEGDVGLLGQKVDEINGEFYAEKSAYAYDRCSEGIALPFSGKTKVTVTVVSGTDTDKWSVFRYTNGAIGTALAKNISFGESVVITIPEEDDGIWLFTIATNIPSARTYGVKFDEIEQSIRVELDGVINEMSEINTEISQLGQEDTDLRLVVGEETTIVLDSLDYKGVIYDGSVIVAANDSFNAFMIKAQAGIEYNISPAPMSCCYNPTPFSVGGSIGGIASLPFTPPSDVYILFTVSTANDTYQLSKGVSGVAQIARDAKSTSDKNAVSIEGNYEAKYKAAAYNRLSKGIPLSFHGKTKISMSVAEGTDTGTWNVYRYTNGALGASLLQNAVYGEFYEINIPEEDDGVWLFTSLTSLSAQRVYQVTFKDMSWTTAAQLSALNNSVGISWCPDSITKATGRVSQSIYIGHGGKNAFVQLSVISGTDNGKWRIYATSNSGASIDVNTPLTDNLNMGKSALFTVPADGYIWLFTEDNSITASRTYSLYVSNVDSIIVRINELSPLAGKKIVCFGDSITEFKYQGKGYSDYLAAMSGAEIINVGVGGTQLRQRTTPSATPSGDTQCYAGLDIVNMVKSAMTNDFTIARASAAELARISADDNTAIVERLAAINWNEVDIVMILGGTNDWVSNRGHLGDKDTTDIGYTCGAINDIINRICSTYTKIKLYWFSPLLRFVDAPAFDAAKQYQIDDLCTYSGAYYKFTAAHLGAWSESDVVSVQRSAFRIPEYSSDNWEYNNITLRDMSAAMGEVVKNNHIPYFDLYNGLGWNIYNFANFFPSYDNTHPYLGFKALAEKMLRLLSAN